MSLLERRRQFKRSRIASRILEKKTMIKIMVSLRSHEVEELLEVAKQGK